MILNQKEEMRFWRRNYTNHRYNSKARNADFLLTFEEWMKIWLDSGHAHERGRGKNLYCMARVGDIGPYATGNVKIILLKDNLIEQWDRPETVQKIRKALVGNTYAKDYKHSNEARIRMSKNSATAKPIVCVSDGKEFANIKEAAIFYGIKKHNLEGLLRGSTKSTSSTLKGLEFRLK